ncbi:ATP-binding cassette domain-containing protein [Candidatus Enterococcus clewellii]|uniref:Teichoic acid transport system ATP-binding protein n=1 Tax=Candidatus Enterococcus clewellii TaxID=1834193 RepID=A0A242JWZ0_9ENTE|nr:ATP-binding cassette domain-containing protein [Enterococcus sp. 9E7_DIV0242]OTP09835.1 hypothetical protein A5888_004031 [Enterococcus sp. 9E7_DIV0242]
MDSELKVKATLLTKEYSLATTRVEKLKTLFNISQNKIPNFWALRGVSLEIYSGETIGIIGLNGSGKSTLSNIISSITPQTSGQLDINGEVSIISIGAGLNGNLTGRENIRMKCLMMGEKNKEIDSKIDDIIEFSELGVFIDQPVKTYSSGMSSKLGFSIAVHQDPDILVIDEALSVGDQTFYNKGLKKMLSFKEQGKTIIFVSHSINQVKQICDRVVWMHYGQMRAFGKTEEIVKDYTAFIKEYNKLSEEEKDAYQKVEKDQQRSYSLEQLQDEIIEETPKEMANRKMVKDIVESTTKNKVGDKMPVATKAFTLFLLFSIMYFSLAYVKQVSVGYAATNPVGTIRRIFKRTTQPNKIINTSPSSTTSEASSSTPVSSTQEVSDTTASSTVGSSVIEGSEPVENAEVTGDGTYTVQEGDSQWAIAEKNGLTVEALQQLNPELIEADINPGQVLIVREVTE